MLTVYSKKNCAFCEQAKSLLKSKNIAFEEVKIDENEDARAFLLGQAHRSVPQLYLDGKLFVEGGYQGLVKMSDEEINKRMNKDAEYAE